MNRRKHNFEIDPDEIFLDSSNLPEFNRQQFEGRIVRALSRKSIIGLSSLFFLIGLLYTYKLERLQILHGNEFRNRSEENSLHLVTLPVERGVIYDRNDVLLAWNDPNTGRNYSSLPGLSHTVGYLGLPSRDELQNLSVKDPTIRVGKMGVERQYDETLRGDIGEKVEEVDSIGEIVSESIHINPIDGSPVRLALDSMVQSALYKYIGDVAKERNFDGGAGILMDVKTGEILALTSYPEVPLSVVSGSTTNQKFIDYFTNSKKPFLNRAVAGSYAPGSVIKPFIAVGALTEGVIDASKQILSTGKIEVPNPYVPGIKSIFKDWKAHGLVDMRHALAVSSNVYFYEVGGGYEGQKGMGIDNINKYSYKFGFGLETGIDMPGELAGVVPSPAWKKEIFNEDWRLGDTYHTSIGQYGFQVTPIQMVRAVSAIANGGYLLTPHIIKSESNTFGKIDLGLPEKNLQIVREGMRLAVLEGTANALNVPYAQFAGKTGTAELGDTKSRVNSWVEGFFPYDNPRYAFVIVMERGHVGNVIGAAYVARQFFDWMSVYAPAYLHSSRSEI
ncbi:MAG TPA: penicillin-binding transpeptidase domain-containing protein [Candidatus Paceibacterota bacterium]